MTKEVTEDRTESDTNLYTVFRRLELHRLELGTLYATDTTGCLQKTTYSVACYL